MGQLNDLNVFPVPDGDTGTNLHLTMRAILQEIDGAELASAGQVARAAAYGALMGARGNSGVILSQILGGMAEILEPHDSFTARELALALEQGTRKAYACVVQPVEGTILTVCRETARAAREAAATGADLVETLASMLAAAHRTVEDTPNMLPVLREAGVVDAGGLGLEIILEGAYWFAIDGTTSTQPSASPTQTFVSQDIGADGDFGYCTEFLVKGSLASPGTVRDRIASLGGSLVVAGEPGLVRVHIHTDRPGQVLEVATSLGTLHKIKIDNMQEQYESRATARRASQDATAISQAPAVSIIAVASGQGFHNLFRHFGATVVEGGETMNPTTGDLLQAMRASAARALVILPNNRNVLLNARQASKAADRPVVVVPTQSMPQGLAALLAFQKDLPIERNADKMEKASRGVTTLEITRAVRDARCSGMRIRRGQAIGLMNGELVVTGDGPGEAALAALAKAGAEAADLITVYFGGATSDILAQQLVSAIKSRYPQQEVELQAGGQPLHDYIISLE